MNKKMIRTIVSIVMVFAIVMINCMPVMAGGYSSAMSGLISTADNVNKPTGASNSVSNVLATVITSARIIGVCFAVVMLLTVAMKYMSAAPGEKADIKKSAMIYVVGAVVLFAVVGILGIVEQFAVIIK